jgi:hypothetical protein
VAERADVLDIDVALEGIAARRSLAVIRSRLFNRSATGSVTTSGWICATAW